MSVMTRLAERAVLLLLRHRGAAIAATLFLLAVSWMVIARAALRAGGPERLFDNRLEVWFKEHDPAMLAYRDLQRRFGNDEAILIALEAGPGEPSVFTPATLGLVAEVSSRVSGVAGVRAVTSLSSVIQVRYQPGGDLMEVDRLWRGPLDPELARAAEAHLRGDRLLRPALVSPDGRVTLLTVQLVAAREPGQAAAGTIDPDAERGRILGDVAAAVRASLEAAGRDPQGWQWGGLGVINEELNRLSQRDLNQFFGLSLVALVVCVGLALRRAIPVLLSVLVVHLATVFLLAIYLGLGHRFNLVTTILPTLVLVIGVTDSIFFVSAWYEEQEKLLGAGLPRAEAVAAALSEALLPGLFNSLTTSVGFFSFLSSEMPVLRDLGLFAGLGIGLAFLCSVLVIAIGFDLFDVRPPRGGGADGRAARSLLGPLLAGLPGLVTRHRGKLLLLVGAVAVVAVAGIAQLRVDTLTIGYLRADNPVRRADASIQAAFGPYLPLEVVVEAPADGGILEPALLRAIARLEEEIAAAYPGKVGGSTSLAGVVARLNEAWAGTPGGWGIPDTREQVEQLLLFYDPARPDDPLRLVDFPAYRRARITFRTASDSAQAAAELLARIEARARQLFPPGVRVVPSGYVPLYVRLIDYLVWGQVWSIGSSFLVVFALIWLLFGSLRVMLVTIPANLLPVAATMGFMGWAGIDLDVATVLIAAVALGIAVDDTIHFVFRFQARLEESREARLALADTLAAAGPPIVSSALILAAGFSVLCLAEVKSVSLFGLLMGVTMLSALVAELLVTPVFVLLVFGERRHHPVGEGL
jgi:hypothetical protein